MYDDIFNMDGINSMSFAMSNFADEDYFYNIVYEAIMRHPSYVILSESNLDRRVQIIGNMIVFFEEKEDYEKCYELFNIKKEIEEKC